MAARQQHNITQYHTNKIEAQPNYTTELKTQTQTFNSGTDSDVEKIEAYTIIESETQLLIKVKNRERKQETTRKTG